MFINRWSRLDESLTIRFTLPVVLENIFLTGIGMVFSALVSHISGSALSAIAFGNQLMNVVNNLFSVLTTGAAALVSRYVGARDGRAAADTVEQAIFVSLIGSVTVLGLYEILNTPILRLLMPTADGQLFAETERYCRVMMLSLPFLVIHGTAGSICRASGNSRSPLIVAVIMNVFQLALAWVLLNVFHMEETGAALSYVGCRILGAVIMVILAWKERSLSGPRLRNVFRPRPATIKTILRMGISISIEFTFVQLGYLLANSMAVALGTREVGAYTVLTTLNGYSSIISSSTAAIAIAAVGHLIGAGRYKDAKRAGLSIWWVGFAFVMLCNAVLWLAGRQLVSLYTNDAETLNFCLSAIPVVCIMSIPAVALNVFEPQLRTGGDGKFVMIVTLCCVWLIRLPLTWLFTFKMNLGVPGIFLGNTIALTVRILCSLIRWRGTRWIHREI